MRLCYKTCWIIQPQALELHFVIKCIVLISHSNRKKMKKTTKIKEEEKIVKQKKKNNKERKVSGIKRTI